MLSFKRTCTILLLILIVALSGGIALAVDDGRTIVDNCRGGCYIMPYGWDWTDTPTNNARFGQFGAYYGMNQTAQSPVLTWFSYMDKYAVKGVQGRLHYHGDLTPTDGSSPDYYSFPYDDAKAFEADEVSKGRQRFWCTATAYGSSRPVINAQNRPFHPPGAADVKSQMYNLGDDRLIQFFIHDYQRKAMRPMGSPPGVVAGIDGCYDWTYRDFADGSWNMMWGVYDNAGVFQYLRNIPVYTLDSPFPQTNDACWSNVAYAINTMNTQAPDVRFIANTPTMEYFNKDADWITWDNMFSNIYGFLFEGFGQIDGVKAGSWTADNCYKFYRNFYLVATRSNMLNKVQFYDVNECQDTTHLKNAFILHLICGGPNRFFGPRDTSAVEINPANYAALKNVLGEPVQAPIATNKDSGLGKQWLYSRRCYGGWAFFNGTTSQQTVNLTIDPYRPPTGLSWYNENNQVVTQLTMAAGMGGYVKLVTVPAVARVMINPRFGASTVVTAPDTNNAIQVKLSTDPWTTGTTIRYTTNGTTPSRTNGSTYNGTAIKVYGNGIKTINAFAYKTGECDGPVSTAEYNVTTTDPEVGFHLAGEAKSEATDILPLLKLSHPTMKTVTVQLNIAPDATMPQATYAYEPGKYFCVYHPDTWSVISGSNASITFQPGEVYKFFQIDLYGWNIPTRDTTLNRVFYYVSTPVTNATIPDQLNSPYYGYTSYAISN